MTVLNENLLDSTIINFYNKILHNEYVIDKSGVKLVEIINWSIKLNPLHSILQFTDKRKTSESYVEKELAWYLSQDLSVNEISKVAKIWSIVCSTKGLVNSNYGWCIFSKENYEQYQHVLKELQNNATSRRALMIYTRPSMWQDYNKDGMSDFICTNTVHCFIRNNKLIYIVNQRSCDFWFGFRNDFAWHCYVYKKLCNDLQIDADNLGIIYNADSLHVYEKHFDIIKEIYKERKLNSK